MADAWNNFEMKVVQGRNINDFKSWMTTDIDNNSQPQILYATIPKIQLGKGIPMTNLGW